MSETIVSRIEKRLATLGLTPRAASLQAGLSGDAIRSLQRATERNPAASPRGETLRKLAVVLETTEQWLLTGRGLEQAPEPTAPEPAPGETSAPMPLSFSRQNLGVFGAAVGGDDGKFVLNGQRLADVLCPPSLEHVEGAYAVFMHGSSMEPRYEAGDILHVHPHMPVKRGDYAVIQFADDDDPTPYGFVKRFIARAETEVVLEQLNPPAGQSTEIRLPRDRVITIHKIVGTATS